MMQANVRICAAWVISQVVGERRSLTALLPMALTRIDERDRGLLQELCYGTLRWYPQLQPLLEELLNKPLKAREKEVHALLLLGLYQLLYSRIPAYAAISETASAARSLGKQWAVGLINAVLRNFQRCRDIWLEKLASDASWSSAHPAWLLRRLQDDWPCAWQQIVKANNAHPAFSVRVNLRRLSRQAYLERLAALRFEAVPAAYNAAGVTLTKACDVGKLLGFSEGMVSVQDLAAQLAAELLDLRPGLRVLDACAAPGGKTCHILEAEPRLRRLLALDKDAERLAQVQSNLQRLGFAAELRTGDAQAPETWWDSVTFDRILLDAPCSATGVIRRHPDIKILRQPQDIEQISNQQLVMLRRLWPLLVPGGVLIYVTCSVLKRENEYNIADFLAIQPDAQERPIAAAWGRACLHGRQILPGEREMDGFYYACLVKSV
jgi:16S rRNA (cytosine967-C5)-methyltransferase